MLGAVVSHASTEQQNTESSKADHRTIRGSSEAIAPGLVSPDQGLAIIGAALESRKPTDSNADCSNLVHAIYERAGLTYSYANSSELYRGVKEFRRILHPQPGDLVVWRGHVGIVISPMQHSFFSAMRSGRGVEFYDSPYWQARGQPRFFRYVKAASRTRFSASTRNANLKPRSSSNAESHDPVPADEDFALASGFAALDRPPTHACLGAMGMSPRAAPCDRRRSRPRGSAERIRRQRYLRLRDRKQRRFISQKARRQAMRRARWIGISRRQLSHKIQGLGDGVWVKSATKPSPEIPFDSVVTPTRPNEPRPLQGFRTSNIAATAGHASARPSSAGGPLVNELRPEPVQWAMSRDVPRPPWSSRSGGTSEPSVPRPPARRVPQTSPAY